MINGRHLRTTLLLLSGALLVSLLVAAVSSALPGDPPIVVQSPADGASVPAVSEGLKVTFTCPTYRTAEEAEEAEEGEEGEEPEEGGEEGEGGEEEGEEGAPEAPKLIPVIGGTEEYGVNFSTSSALGKDGRLTTTGFGEAGEGESEYVKGTPWCSSELELPTAVNPAVLYEGRIFWQAYRECEGCASGYETGPVSSFVVYPYIEEAELNFSNHVFGGYLTKVSFATGAELKGTTIALQEWDGSAWATIAAEPGNNAFANSFFVKLDNGHRLLRADVVGNGITLPTEAKMKTVRKAKGSPPAPVKPGTWIVAGKKEAEEFPATFKVAKGGTLLKGLNASVEAFCKGPTKAENTTIEATAVIKAARIAPDGTVTGRTELTGATPTVISLTGNFFNGRFTGELNSTFATCSGFRQFEAVLQPPTKK